ncbi:MAG: dihydrodipicolinate reductase [Candidatus Limnocylindrales bacterium]
MVDRVKIVHMGLGPIGLATFRVLRERSWAAVVGGVDIDAALEGRDIGALAGGPPVGVAVKRSFGDIGPAGSAEVVVHCAGSHLAEGATDQVLQALAWGANVVSTCEELSYPWFHHPDEARRIDEAARSAGRTVLATGVNPGFAMDALALYTSGISEEVTGVRIHRAQEAGVRREPLQRKVGAGITPEEFAARKRAGGIGHVGLVESVAMISAAFGFDVDRIEESLEPAIATTTLTTQSYTVKPGRVAGIIHKARGFKDGSEVVTLELDMFIGVPDPGDFVTLEGKPNVKVAVSGLHGDVCTAAMAANAVRALGGLPNGLVTMIDAAPVRLYR